MSYSFIVSYSTTSTGPWTQAGTSTVPNFTISGLPNGSYYVQVIAVDTVTSLQSAPVVGGPFQISATVSESADPTSITTSGQIINSSQTPGQAAPAGGPFDTWALTGSNGQVIHNGVVDSATTSVVMLYYHNHTVFYESNNGNNLGTPGWWQWSASANIATTFISGFATASFTDNSGNLWSTDGQQNAFVTPSGGSQVALGTYGDIGFNVEQVAYYNNAIYVEDSRDLTWHIFTLGPNTFGGSVAAPQANWSSTSGWVACASPIASAAPTITGISLSNSTVAAGSPAGTVVGTFTVTMSTGTFSGQLTLGGANASSFSLSGLSLQEAASLTAGNYSISATATQSNASNSPLTVPFSIIAQASANGPGPAASSPFITADFTSPMQWPVSGGGQQTVDQGLWGISSSSLSNNINGVDFYGWAQSDVTSALAVINPGLVYVKDGGINYFDSSQNLVTSKLANLVNNFYKIDPLGICKFIIGVDWDVNQVVSGGTATPAQYATAMANLARYLFNYTMPNGKKFPLFGMIGRDEPDGTFTEAQVVSYYNQWGPAVKAVNSNIKIIGPNLSFMNPWLDFPTQVSSLDIFSWDTFTGENNTTDPNDLSGLTNQPTRYTGDANTGSTGLSRKPSAMMIGGYGMNDGGPASANSYVGAVYVAQSMVQTLNNANVTMFAGLWGGWGNGPYGAITSTLESGWYGFDGTTKVTPKGYMLAQGTRKLFGPRWNVPTNSSGMLTLATTPASGRFSLMMVNSTNVSRSGSVALSHWPVNSSGSGTANVWQMTSAQSLPGMDGTTGTVQVINGVCASLNFPGPSITIISV